MESGSTAFSPDTIGTLSRSRLKALIEAGAVTLRRHRSR